MMNQTIDIFDEHYDDSKHKFKTGQDDIYFFRISDNICLDDPSKVYDISLNPFIFININKNSYYIPNYLIENFYHMGKYIYR